MHLLELDDSLYQGLTERATQKGKTLVQWLKDIAVLPTPTVSRPVGLAKDKCDPIPDSFFEPLPDELLVNCNGEPISADGQNFPDLSEFRAKFPKQAISAGEFCRQMRDEDRY